MMTRLIFVHGTGTRAEDYTKSIQRITRGVQSLPHIRVYECRWGETVGARLNLDGASIPTYPDTKAIAGPEALGEVVDADRLEVLWDLLSRDPTFELFLLAQGVNRDADLGGGETPAALKRLAAGLESTAAGKRLAAQLDTLQLSKEFTASVQTVRKLPQAASAAGQPGGPAALARAVIAFLAFLHPGEDSRAARVFADPIERDGLARALQQHLEGGGDEKGLTDFVSGLANKAGKAVTGLAGLAALKSGTWLGKRRRGQLMDAATPGAGDILLYQARGKQIRDFIRTEIRRGPEPVVLLAHSLGGVACVDLLLETPDVPVVGLITVGSQAPYFYEIGALQLREVNPQLAPGDRLPKTFPPWLNCYDLRDFLSYVGRPVFGNKVTDEAVDNGHMFPSSHITYWSNEQVWGHIRARLSRP